jgi:hypothetical protein
MMNSVPAKCMAAVLTLVLAAGWLMQTARAQTSLGKPTNAQVTSSSTTQINLSWTDTSTGETGHKIERRIGDGTWSQIATVASGTTTYGDTNGGSGFNANVPYAYRIRAYDASANGAFSDPVNRTLPPSSSLSIKTDAGVYAPPSLPVRPMRGGIVYDPTFGTPMLRLTDEADTGSKGTAYSYWQTINADNTKVLELGTNVVKIHTIDPVNLKVVGDSISLPSTPDNRPCDNESPIWHATDADKLYCHEGTKIWRYSALNNSYTLVKDLAGFMNSGDYIYQWSMSDDADVFAFTRKHRAENPETYTAVGYMVYRVSTNTVLRSVTTQDINEVKIDKTGRYLLYTLGNPNPVETQVIDLQATPQTVTELENIADRSPGHYDLGTGFLVGASDVFPVNGPADYGIFARSMATPKDRTKLFDLNPMNDGGSYHLSMIANNESWALVSFYLAHANGIMSYEVTQFKTDGSGQVRRLLHHRSTSGDYYSQPRANISRDGSLIAFASDWGNSGRTDLYVAKIAPAPAAGPEPVVWTDIVNGTAEADGGITKLNATPGLTAYSTQDISSGEGYFLFTPNTNGSGSDAVDLYLLSGGSTPHEFRFNVASGAAQIYEDGNYKTDVSFTVGDSLKMAVETVSGVKVIKYYKNDTWVRTSNLSIAYPIGARANLGWDAATGKGLSAASCFGAN